MRIFGILQSNEGLVADPPIRYCAEAPLRPSPARHLLPAEVTVFAAQNDPYAVHTPAFDGPLELLLYLIRRDGIDVRDLPIAHITREYLRFLECMKELDLNVAGEFLVMAATLCQLKSRELLPRRRELDADEEEEDPRERLSRRLIDYERYKRASEALFERSLLGREVFTRPDDAAVLIDRPVDPGVDVFGLLETCYALLTKQAEPEPVHQVEREVYSLSERVSSLLHWLDCLGSSDLSVAFDQCHSKGEVIVTFLALLEMARLQLVDITQDEHLGPVMLTLKVSAQDADLSALPAEA